MERPGATLVIAETPVTVLYARLTVERAERSDHSCQPSIQTLARWQSSTGCGFRGHHSQFSTGDRCGVSGTQPRRGEEQARIGMARGAQTQPVVDVTLNLEPPQTRRAAALYILSQVVSAGRTAELCCQARAAGERSQIQRRQHGLWGRSSVGRVPLTSCDRQPLFFTLGDARWLTSGNSET
jgi:hypothetical protein